MGFRFSTLVLVCSLTLLTCIGAHAASKAVDLDGNAANGAESQCDLNVLQTFPVMIENRVTNKSSGNAFAFSWPSAGPGGFTSSVTAGTTGGVGAKWVWTTNQSVFSYTGNNCDNDVCFTQTAGPDSIPSYCSFACLADATSVTVTKGATAGTVVLNWTGGQGPFTVYRATGKSGVAVPANAVGTTNALTLTDTPPATDTAAFYVVRGATCTTRKSCDTNADCSAPGDGTCVGRGPFGVPGRSLFATNVTVSAASLTSSLITFFSPPTEVFRATSTAGAGGIAETVTNSSTNPVTVITPAYPPGCCPADPAVPHQLRCGESCVDYLNDPDNCGACGNVCGDGTCCSNGNCVSLCAEGDLWCTDECADVQDDSSNCGGCGIVCGDGTCCNNGTCDSLCGESQVWCDNLCVDFQNDSGSCGSCGTPCGDGTCCDGGACVSVCPEGQVWCGAACVDFWNDSANCGACGTTCGEGSCCNEGACESFCPAGQVLCGEECVDFDNDSANCGACANVCGDGTCCNEGACESFCPAGQVLCGTQCVDFDNDSANCGACGNACGDGTCCNEGACASVCPAGQVWCNNQCVDLQNDSDNCEACGNACGDGTCCNEGACESFCPAGQVLCGTQCVDFDNDSANCGACGNACGEGSCCNEGACESFCPAGQVLCGTQCVDFNNDNGNCGACGNACGDGTCCHEGVCASVCPAGQVWCNNQCVDLQNDSDNCGACGNECGEDSCCNAGACVSVCPAGYTLCAGQCVNLQSDRNNCGSCGHVCGNDEINGHDSHNRCRNGQCERDDLFSSLDNPPPISPVCPNPTPTHPGPGHCPNSTPTEPTPGYCHNATPSEPTPGYCRNESPSDPIPGYCQNQAPTEPTPGYCRNESPTDPIPGYCQNPTPTEPTPGFCQNKAPSDPIPGSCPNPTPSSPVAGYCQNQDPSPGPVAGVCPESGEPAPIENEAATCTIPEATTTIPPGGSSTTCTGGGVLFKEIATEITVCGDGIPGVDGLCGNTATRVTTGTFNRLVPDTTIILGNAYVTPYAVRVVADTSNDGLIEPGETASLVIEALNAGPMNITNARATLAAQVVDLTDDGVVNPVGITVNAASVSYGTIFGTPLASNCVAPPLQPASNATVFQITVPANHPGDTSHPLILTVNGTVDGGPFTMSVPVVIGIADKCDFAAHTGDYDGVDGLSNPMRKLVPTGETLPVAGPFSAGSTRPLKLRVLCGGTSLTATDVEAPEIIGLSEATRGALDIRALNLNSDNTNNPNDPFFRFGNNLSGGQWSYSMRTSLIGTGTFTLKIRIAGRKEYVTGFILR